jgi:FAD binding domain/D-arabinono-1,4-lactone oxidase
MPCPGDGSTGSRRSSWLFRNWGRTRSFSIPMQLQPSTVQEIVAGVEEVERTGGILKAIGSGWSYTDAAVTTEVTHVMDTSALSQILNGLDPDSTSSLIPFTLNEESISRAQYFIHVEAGIKIHALNCELDRMGLAMPTLGGSNGQSLAGAISTGTHGGDVDLPPIADAVKAIHLVGPGGQEWWIEPSGENSITDPARMAEVIEATDLLCRDIRVEYDDRLFRAALVSLGRMGIIYSVVIEVVDAFRLREERESTTWSVMADWIRRDIVGVGVYYTGPRFVEIVLSPYRNTDSDHNCVVTRRTATTDEISPEAPPSPDVFQILCNIESLTPLLGALAATIPGLIAAATAVALAGISWMLGIPFVGGIVYAAASTIVVAAATTALVALETALISALTTPGENISEKLANICNLAVAVGQKQIVPDLINLMVNFIRDPNTGSTVRESFRIMTGQNSCKVPWGDSPNCMRQIDGLEFALDVTPGRDNLFRFIDDVFALTDEFYNANRPAGFGLSLRFTKGTNALIGMQQYTRTCSVEFLMLRGFEGHGDFKRRLYQIAERHAAIPHWGLIHEINATQVRALYGDKLTDWRIILGRLIDTGRGRVTTFSTSFSIQRDLEPLPGCTIPPPLSDFLVDLFRRILMALARADGMRRLFQQHQ